ASRPRLADTLPVDRAIANPDGITVGEPVPGTRAPRRGHLVDRPATHGIRPGLPDRRRPDDWADLGAGGGLRQDRDLRAGRDVRRRMGRVWLRPRPVRLHPWQWRRLRHARL